MTAPAHDLTIDRAALWALSVPLADAATGEPFSLAGCTAEFAVLGAWVDAEPLLLLTTASGQGVTLDDSQGIVDVVMTEAQVDLLAGIDVGVYRLRLIDGAGVPAVLLTGRVFLSPELHRGAAAA